MPYRIPDPPPWTAPLFIEKPKLAFFLSRTIPNIGAYLGMSLSVVMAVSIFIGLYLGFVGIFWAGFVNADWAAGRGLLFAMVGLLGIFFAAPSLAWGHGKYEDFVHQCKQDCRKYEEEVFARDNKQ